MQADHHSDSGGVWALAWRAIVYAPLMLAASLLLIFLLFALVLSPILTGIFLFFGFWWQGLSSLVFWLFIVGAWHRFRLRRFYELGTSFL